MEKVTTVLQVIVPIFAAIFLGMLARKTRTITPEENRGLQQFVVQYGLPCVLFNSCLNCELGAEAVTSMALLLPLLLASVLWAFRAGRKKHPYHNFPMIFVAKESGMLGIPLFMALFGAEQAYRMGVLDITQAIVATPTLAILSTAVDENPTPGQVAKRVLRSPILIMSLLGLGFNLTGVMDWLNGFGVGAIITETTSFIAEPVSAAILFSVGYNFSMEKGNRGEIFRISALQFAFFGVICLVIQGALFLVPSVEPETRWAAALYCALPASFLVPSLGRNEEEYTLGSGVCSVMTVVSLLIFCVMSVLVA